MWFIFAAIAVFCFAGMQLLMKQLSNMGLLAPVILAVMFATSGLLYWSHVAVTRSPLHITPRALVLMIVAGALSYAGNLYMLRSIGIAPNPGYTVAITGLQAVPVVVAAVFLFGSEFSWIKAVGVLLSAVGVGLLLIDTSRVTP
jgi:drug/metabolite transporter (DMT)-like permease